jgi:hypothetical protein
MALRLMNIVHIGSTVKGDKLKLLGKDLSPVDAGDFDSDGKSEWMFMYSGYNESGYCLFFENFSKKVEFNWVYH